MKQAYTALIAVCLFLIPLIYFPFFSHSFVQGKELTFKLIVLIFALLGIVSIIKTKNKITIKPFWQSNLSLIGLLLMATMVLTALFSPHPIVSIYGSYSRGFGLIMYFFFGAWCLINILILNKKHISLGIKAIYCASVIVATYAIFQKLGFDPLFKNFSTSIFVGRPFSFLGNPGYLGQFLLLSFVAGIYIFSQCQSKREKILILCSQTLILATIFLSGTRAAVFGCFVILLLISIKNYRYILRHWKIFGSITIGSIFLAGLLLLNMSYLGLSTSRFNLSSSSLRSLYSRFEIWKSSVNLIAERPFGYGPESFQIHFPEKVTKNFLTLEEDINLSADRIHNEFLEVTFSGGVVGAILYILFLFILLRRYFVTKDKLTAVLALMVLANLVQNQLTFSDTSIMVVVIFCIGALISIEIEALKDVEVKIQKFIGGAIVVCGLLFMVFVFRTTTYHPFISHDSYTLSHSAQYNSFEISINSLKNATYYTPYYSDLWYELMIMDDSSMPRALHYLQQIEGESGNVLAWNGNRYALSDPQLSYSYFEEALNKNPSHPNWLRAYAEALYNNKEYKKSLEIYERYLESVPDFWKWKDSLKEHSAKERISYEVFFKHTPYFWKIVEKVENLRRELSTSPSLLPQR